MDSFHFIQTLFFQLQAQPSLVLLSLYYRISEMWPQPLVSRRQGWDHDSDMHPSLCVPYMYIHPFCSDCLTHTDLWYIVALTAPMNHASWCAWLCNPLV